MPESLESLQAWLKESPRIPLYIQWRMATRPRWWQFWRFDRELYRPAGHLLLTEESLSEVMGTEPHTAVTGTKIALDEPFHVHTAYVRYGDDSAAELALTVRQLSDRGRPAASTASGLTARDDAVRCRTMWPFDDVPGDVPFKREASLFVEPTAFARVWTLLSRMLEVHGRAPLPELPDVAEQAYGLASQGRVRRCAACRSPKVRPSGPDIYTCVVCGYEGGEGVMKREAAERRARLEALPEAERRSRALRLLRESVAQLEQIEHDLPSTWFSGSSQEGDIPASMPRVIKELGAVHNDVRDARWMLRERGDGLDPVVETLARCFKLTTGERRSELREICAVREDIAAQLSGLKGWRVQASDGDDATRSS